MSKGPKPANEKPRPELWTYRLGKELKERMDEMLAVAQVINQLSVLKSQDEQIIISDTPVPLAINDAVADMLEELLHKRVERLSAWMTISTEVPQADAPNPPTCEACDRVYTEEQFKALPWDDGARCNAPPVPSGSGTVCGGVVRRKPRSE